MLNRILHNLQDYPQDACYEIGGTVYRSGELYRFACSIFRHLLRANPQKKPVAVCGHKQIYMLASFLACACAGMPYAPIDVSVPEARKRRILQQLDPAVVLDGSVEELMREEGESEPPQICMGDDDVCYIIFTSGSSGEPKGVQISYGNLKSCMRWLEELCGIRNGVILNQASFAFDLSVADLYLPLLTRSRHFILERSVQRDYSLLFRELRRSEADLAVFTPSFLDLLLVDRSFDARLMPRLKTVLLCGEKLTKRTVTELFARFPGIRLINCYGPTECTFAVTSAEITDPDDLPIGKPKNGTSIYVVNERLEALEDERPGELLITGDSVGKGYLGPADSGGFLTYRGEKAYRTGDYGYRHQGRLYFIGRKDSQVKLKGCRIELSEIERAIEALDGVERAVAVPVERDGRLRRIAAFVKLEPSCPMSELGIRNRLRSILPDYMIPKIKPVDRIPLTPNGKTDVQALLEKLK